MITITWSPLEITPPIAVVRHIDNKCLYARAYVSQLIAFVQVIRYPVLWRRIYLNLSLQILHINCLLLNLSKCRCYKDLKVPRRRCVVKYPHFVSDQPILLSGRLWPLAFSHNFMCTEERTWLMKIVIFVDIYTHTLVTTENNGVMDNQFFPCTYT